MDLLDFVLGLAALVPTFAAGALFIKVVVDAGKALGVVPDGTADKVAMALNAILYVGVGLAAVFGYDGKVLAVIDQLTTLIPPLVIVISTVLVAFYGSSNLSVLFHRWDKWREGGPINIFDDIEIRLDELDD